MEGIDLNREYTYFELSKILNENRREIGKLPTHELNVGAYVKLLSYYPFNEEKEKIFKSLNKSQKMGMLNRHVLSVARKLDISNILLKKAKDITIDLATSKKNAKTSSLSSYFKPNYFKEQEEKYRHKLQEFYNIILDMIIEETIKRFDVKYMRKQKLEEITQLGIH